MLELEQLSPSSPALVVRSCPSLGPSQFEQLVQAAVEPSQVAAEMSSDESQKECNPGSSDEGDNDDSVGFFI